MCWTHSPGFVVRCNGTAEVRRMQSLVVGSGKTSWWLVVFWLHSREKTPTILLEHDCLVLYVSRSDCYALPYVRFQFTDHRAVFTRSVLYLRIFRPACQAVQNLIRPSQLSYRWMTEILVYAGTQIKQSPRPVWRRFRSGSSRCVVQQGWRCTAGIDLRTCRLPCSSIHGKPEGTQKYILR
jgi:hypothetical protein